MLDNEAIVPIQFFHDDQGNALGAGYVYFGVDGQDPEAFPITVYWDRDLSIPASQPIRTIAGRPDRDGAPGTIFVAGGYSMRVKTSVLTTVYTVLSAADTSIVSAIDWNEINNYPSSVSVGTVMINLSSGERYKVVSSGEDITTSSGIKLRYLWRKYSTYEGLAESNEDSRGIGSIWSGPSDFEEVSSGQSLTLNSGVKLKAILGETEGISVKAFGAKGDGTTDDTAAIQAAIDAKIGTVVFPEGEYRTTAPINLGTDTPSLKGVGKRYNSGISTIIRFDHAGDGIVVNGQSHIGTVFEDITFRRATAHIASGINVKFDGEGGPSNIISATTMNRCYVEGGASGIWLRGLINGVFTNIVCQGQATAGIHFYGTGTAPASNIISFDSFNVYNVTGGSAIRYEGTDCGRNHIFSSGSFENCGRAVILGSGDIAQNITFENCWIELCSSPMQLMGGRKIKFRKVRNAQSSIDLIDAATFGAEEVSIEGVLGGGINSLLGVPGISVKNYERTVRAGAMVVSDREESHFKGATIGQAYSGNQVSGGATLSTVRQSGPFLKNFLENWNIGGSGVWTKPSGVTAAADPLGGTEAWSINADQTISGLRQNSIPDNAVGVQMQYAIWAKGEGSIDLYNRGDGFAKRMEFQLDTPEWTRLLLRYVTEDATNDRALGFYMVCNVASAGSLSIWRPGIYAGFSSIDGRPVGANGGFEGGQPVAYASGERAGRNLVVYGTAAPASETWMVGDKVINTAPSAGGNAGWVCTTAGTPGTWKTYGVIAS